MKKQFLPLLATILVCFATNLSGQKAVVAKTKIDDYLPGKSYGLGFIIPPVTLSDNPTPPELPHVECDLGIEIIGTPIIKLLCPDYFTVEFKVRIQNFNGSTQTMLQLQLKDEYTQPINPQSGAISSIPSQYLIIDKSDETIINAKFKMYYPYTVRDRSGAKRYLQIPYKITASIGSGGQVPGSHPTILVMDTNQANNQSESNLVTPLPPACVAHPNNTQ